MLESENNSNSKIIDAADAESEDNSSKKPSASFFIIKTFLHHKIAANLLAIAMLIIGLLSIARMNTQFFPTTEIPGIHVSVPWSGATSNDIQNSILDIVEPNLRLVNGLKKLRSNAISGYASINMDFVDGYDMIVAQSDIEQIFDQAILPEDADDPSYTLYEFRDAVGTLLLVAKKGVVSEIELKNNARAIRDGLLEAGVDDVELGGIRTDEIWVEVDNEKLLALGLTLDDVTRRISSQNRDLPVGTLSGVSELKVRVVSQQRTASGIGALDLLANQNGERIFIRDVASVRDKFKDGSVSVLSNGNRAVVLEVQRGKTSDVLEIQDIMQNYADEVRKDLRSGLELKLVDNNADLVKERIDLLLRNGLSGAAILLVLLFLFLSPRVAIWVAAGIPISLLGAMVGMYFFGQSINMISLFAMILVLGILVDDAIVVGEHSSSLYERGFSPVEAASRGVTRMALPVTAAVITTQVAFLPLLIVQGVIGQIMSAIPILVIIALSASLIESFFILPAHMRGALTARQAYENDIKSGKKKPSKLHIFWDRFQGGFNRWFDRFKNNSFRRFVTACYRWRYATLSASVGFLIISLATVGGGYVKFQFFPQPEAEIINANLTFVSGSSETQVEEGIKEVEAALRRVDTKFGSEEPLGKVVKTFHTYLGRTNFRRSDNLAQMVIELTPTDERNIRTEEIISQWRKEIKPILGLASYNISGRMGGPPGGDIEAEFSGADVRTLKEVSGLFQQHLSTIPAVYAIRDNIPYGKEELKITLTPLGKHLGFSALDLANKLQNTFNGAIAQRIARNTEDVIVRVKIDENFSDLSGLRNLQLKTKFGDTVPFTEVAQYEKVRSFDRIPRINGKNTITVYGSVRSEVQNAIELRNELKSGIIAELTDKYGVNSRFGGKEEEQADTFKDMQTGGIIALILIFFVLAWVFESYSKPIIIMAIIPFGLIGTIFGHFMMGIELTILSIFGLIGLFGVLVNDSIVLVDRVHELEKRNVGIEEAVIEGTIDRLRAITITTLTTIGGLTPLLFEQSLQAQFLKPMAVTIVFGLAFASILVVGLVPAFLGIHSDLTIVIRKFYRWLRYGDSGDTLTTT